MTVFTTIITPNDYHDTRFLNPTPNSPSVEYEIPPTSYLTLYHIQRYINDIGTIPLVTHNNSILSLSISNTSLSSYKSSKTLNAHFDILVDNCKLRRINLNFTQFKFKSGIITRLVSLVNHLQKKFEYNLHVAVTLPVEKGLYLSEEFLNVIKKFKKEFIHFNMVTVLVSKEIKMRGVSWVEIFQNVIVNVKRQLKEVDVDDEMFVGDIEKYIGVEFDGDVCEEEGHSLRRVIHHGERKNMQEGEFLQIWELLNMWKIRQFKLRCYLSNCRNVDRLLHKTWQLHNDETLKLPKDLLIELIDEMSSDIVEDDLTIEESIEEPQTPPPYDKVIEDKINEHEKFLNDLVKLPSYYSNV